MVYQSRATVCHKRDQSIYRRRGRLLAVYVWSICIYLILTMPMMSRRSSVHDSSSSSDSPSTVSDGRRESATPLPRKPIPRKGHTKSRRGCFNCKRRRIKCSERHPECNHCIKVSRLSVVYKRRKLTLYPHLCRQVYGANTLRTSSSQHNGRLLLHIPRK